MTKTKGNLSEKAMLVDLQLSVWTGRKKDKNITEEVQELKKADNDSGAWWTYLIPKTHLRPINATCQQCRAVHNHLTLPWLDGGIRILPAAIFMKYSKEMRKVTVRFDKAVEDFLKDYPTIISNAHKRLGKLLDGKHLPSVEEIRNKFGHHSNIFPVPNASDFRVNMNDMDANRIRQQISKSLEEMTAKAMNELWNQLIQLIEKIETTLDKPDKKFKNSLINNLKEFCELIPKLNITDDEELENIRKESIKKLAELIPNNLRDSKDERKIAHKAAKDVLEKIKGYKKL